jgi:nitroreductase
MELDVNTLLTTTRTVRRRLDLDRPVPRELVEECVEVALQAPCGGNRRAYRFVIVDDEDRRAAIGDIYRRGFEVYRAGPTVVTKAFEGDSGQTAVQERIYASVEHLAEHLHEVPVLVIPVMRGRCEERTAARTQSGFWGSVYPAIWSFMLAGRARGLGMALTTMHLEFERETADVLDIPFEEYTQVALLPVAYTVGDRFRPAVREPASTFVHWNGWRR